MTQHPITPPPELVDEWVNTWNYAQVEDVNDYVFLTAQAARWGADQELEACVEWIKYTHTDDMTPDALRAARRPSRRASSSRRLSNSMESRLAFAPLTAGI